MKSETGLSQREILNRMYASFRRLYPEVANAHPGNPKEDKSDFYTLFYSKALNSDFSKLTEYEQNYIMAMLVRGGVFGEKKESDKE